MHQIRKATAADTEALYELYQNHLTTTPPSEPQDLAQWRDFIRAAEDNPAYNILVCITEERAVSSVTLVIIANLTHNVRPYALIENVVTHEAYRGRGLATALMAKADEMARRMGCYKMMLLTGSKREETLNFYRQCGYNTEDKTAFHKRLP